MDSSRRRYARFRQQSRESRRRKSHGTTASHAAPTTSDAGARPKKRRGGYFREYLKWLKPFWREILSVLLLALVAAGLSLILPRATMHIVDVVLPQRQVGVLHTIGLALLLIITVQQVCDWFRNWKMARLNARVLFRLRQRLYNHMLRLPLHELFGLKTGGITSRLSGDVDSVTGIVQIAVITPAVATVKVVLTLMMLVWINWQMCMAAVFLLPPLVVLNLVYIRRIRPIYRSMRDDRQEIDGRVVETFGGIRVVRGFGRERFEAASYGKLHHTVIRKQLLARVYEHLVGSGWGYLIPLCALIIIWFGGTLVLNDQTTVGGIIAFQMYVMMLLAPVSTIVQSYGQTQQALAAMERIFDVLNLPLDKPDAPGAERAPRRVESIRFENVSFAYPQMPAALAVGGSGEEGGTDAPHRDNVLHDVNLDVPGGATVALVGPSGAGKTTVTNLVARFYDPTVGVIRLNGADLRDLQLRSFRRLLGIVQQDVFLFDGSIADNIRYGRPNATREELLTAARRANAHEFIEAFPDGYETVIGERGVRLSGGQAQRVSIARAILADPQILILDEATSNLDTESEQLIQASLVELMGGRTTFVIAHRLSTVVNADLIVVLHEGRVLETGTHADLMARDSRYRGMVERQQQSAARLDQEPSWFG